MVRTKTPKLTEDQRITKANDLIARLGHRDHKAHCLHGCIPFYGPRNIRFHLHYDDHKKFKIVADKPNGTWQEYRMLDEFDDRGLQAYNSSKTECSVSVDRSVDDMVKTFNQRMNMAELEAVYKVYDDVKKAYKEMQAKHEAIVAKIEKSFDTTRRSVDDCDSPFVHIINLYTSVYCEVRVYNDYCSFQIGGSDNPQVYESILKTLKTSNSARK